MNNTIDRLASYFCPYGSLDLRAACKIWDKLELDEEDLFDIIDEWKRGTCSEGYEKIDPVAAVLEHALQMARNDIEQATGYDFMNDFAGQWCEVYTYGNYLASSYDYGEEAKAELEKKIANHHAELSESIWCRYVLSELDITVNTQRE